MIKVEFFTKNTTSNQCNRILSLPFDKHMLDKGVLAYWHRDILAEQVDNPNITDGTEIFPFELKNIVQWFILPKMPKYVDENNHYARQFNKCIDMIENWKSGNSIVVRIKQKQRRTK